jgi:hypothetical protein
MHLLAEGLKYLGEGDDDCGFLKEGGKTYTIPPDHQLLDSAPNLGPLISRWEINKLENCRNKSDRILEVLKLLFQ